MRLTNVTEKTCGVSSRCGRTRQVSSNSVVLAAGLLMQLATNCSSPQKLKVREYEVSPLFEVEPAMA